MSAQTIVVPELCRDESLGALCPDLRWMCPRNCAESDVIGVAWPLSAAEAAACLREAEQWATSGLTAAEARSRHLLACAEQTLRRENHAARDVRRALAAVPAGHAPEPAVPADRGGPHPELLQNAQRFLLFAWAQEKRLREIRCLAMQSAGAARRLRHVLSEGEPYPPAGLRPETPPETPHGGDGARLAPAWRPVLERLALFLPATAVLCARDARMIEDLEEAGLCRDFLESAGLGCPDALLPLSPSLRGRLRGACLPMWRVLGYTRAQRARPWLDARRTLIIMPVSQ